MKWWRYVTNCTFRAVTDSFTCWDAGVAIGAAAVALRTAAFPVRNPLLGYQHVVHSEVKQL